jgi:hypothetical protein
MNYGKVRVALTAGCHAHDRAKGSFFAIANDAIVGMLANRTCPRERSSFSFEIKVIALAWAWHPTPS